MDGNKEQHQYLVTAVRESFEHLAFMQPVFLTSLDPPTTVRVFWVCEMLVIRPVGALFCLRIEHGALKKTAASIWGRPEESLDDNLLTDTLAELLNTVGGKYMQLVLPDGRQFQLGLPKVTTTDGVAGGNDENLCFELEGYNFQVSLSGKELLGLEMEAIKDDSTALI